MGGMAKTYSREETEEGGWIRKFMLLLTSRKITLNYDE